MVKGTREGVVRRIQPVSIHGQISLDVICVDPDALDGQANVARLGPESIPKDLEPGDRILVHFLMGVATSVTRA